MSERNTDRIGDGAEEEDECRNGDSGMRGNPISDNMALDRGLEDDADAGWAEGQAMNDVASNDGRAEVGVVDGGSAVCSSGNGSGGGEVVDASVRL